MARNGAEEEVRSGFYLLTFSVRQPPIKTPYIMTVLASHNKP